MKVGLWAEIRRLAEIEKLSARVISRRLHCSWRTVARALELERPPAGSDSSRVSRLGPYKAKIDALLAQYPELSAVRVHEERQSLDLAELHRHQPADAGRLPDL